MPQHLTTDDIGVTVPSVGALALKANTANPVFTGTVTIPDGALAIADTNGLQAALDAKVASGLGLVLPRTLSANQTVPSGSDIYVPFGVAISATITLEGNARMIFIQPNGLVALG